MLSNNKTYYCFHCKSFFDQMVDGVLQEIDGRAEHKQSFCPHCHRDDEVSEADICAHCGDAIVPFDEHTVQIDDDEYIFCESCVREIAGRLFKFARA